MLRKSKSNSRQSIEFILNKFFVTVSISHENMKPANSCRLSAASLYIVLKLESQKTGAALWLPTYNRDWTDWSVAVDCVTVKRY